MAGEPAPQAPSQLTDLDKRSVEVLKAFGKTLGQMSLYKIGHPAVAATLKIAEEQLVAVLSQAPNGDLMYSFDGDKLIANGRIVGAISQLPTSVTSFFTRFKLASMTFKAGVTTSELAALCELAATRPDAAVVSDPQAYIVSKGISHVVFSEAVYQKMSEEALLAAIEQRSLDEVVQAMIGTAISDPKQQRKAYERVTKLLEEDIQKRIDEIVKPLQAEKTQVANESVRAQGVLQNMVEGVVMVDEQGKILMMNPAAEQVYGASLAQLAGQHLAAKTGEEHLVTLAAEIATPRDRAISPEMAVTGDEETKRTIKAAGAVVQNQDGKVVGVVASLTDVSKQKELQKMQRDFIAHVTHELRAPLSSIRAALEILEGEVRGKIKEDETRMLTTALKNSDRLAELINSILDFSKIESGQMQVYPKPTEAERIAREGTDSLAAWASKKRINLTLEAAPSLPVVIADHQRTVQVLINLLSNAIKFTPVGGRISVRVAEAPKGQTNERFVEFAVQDSGSGIPKADQKKIFEKFVQIAAGEMHVGGTGLGLAIAKALVHLQGGKMWVDSEQGKGATFFFTIPVAGAENKTPAPVVPAAPLPWWKKLLGLKK
jgi:PAS domain S-box-containing protein